MARIGVRNRSQLGLRDVAARLGHERRVQRALGVVRFLDRMHLRPQVVRAQVIVRDAQASGRVSF
jgi:hypothetical protein